MGHLTTKDAYKSLEERINWFTQGAPASETLYKILQVLYTEEEAKWVALLPVRPFTANGRVYRVCADEDEGRY